MLKMGLKNYLSADCYRYSNILRRIEYIVFLSSLGLIWFLKLILSVSLFKCSIFLSLSFISCPCILYNIKYLVFVLTKLSIIRSAEYIQLFDIRHIRCSAQPNIRIFDRPNIFAYWVFSLTKSSNIWSNIFDTIFHG